MPLALSDQQLQQVTQAAGLLSPPQRDGFLRSVAGRLAGITRPTSAQLTDALCFVLSERGVAIGRRAFRAEPRRVAPAPSK
jgi:hypothetical protein